MGHAYLAAEDCDEAEVLGVMSSADDALMELMLTLHEEQKQIAIPAERRVTHRQAHRRKSAEAG